MWRYARARAQRRGDAVRDAPAGGRVAPRPRRGGRRRALRAQVPRRGPGAEGARRRGGRRGARARARISGARSSSLLELDATIGRAEPDPEIQDLLLASDGLNLGVDFLPGALPFSPAAGPGPEPDFAADVVWLDALATNVDRTPQNPNLLWWHGRLWLIDHGAALYFHHAADVDPEHARGRFEAVRDHVLLPYASSIEDADRRLAGRVTPELLEDVVAAVPEEWLATGAAAGVYVDYLLRRLEEPRGFVEEAERARG